MKRPSCRRNLALLLAAFLALGMSLSAVQSSEMTVRMAMASDAGAAGQGACNGCAGADDSGHDVSCSSVLICSSAAILPVERGHAVAKLGKMSLPISDVARDLAAPPDPYPPKSLHIG